MVVNKKVTGKSKPMAVGLAVGCVFALILTLLGAALSANLVLSGKLQVQSIGYAAVVILLLASSMGSWISAIMIKRRWLVVCLGTGGSYYLMLLAITALFFGGQYQGMGVTAMLVLGGCGAVGLLGLKGERGAGKKTKKYRFR